ncbi:MAG: hypothetical protein ACRDHP_08285, partial [Ktedonobacterales bacterium]
LLVLPIAAEMACPYLKGMRWVSLGNATTQLARHMWQIRCSGRARRAVVALVLPLVALAGYCGYLALRFGRPLGFLNAEGGTWGRRASWPWDSFARASAAVLRDPPNQALPAALDLTLMALFLAVTVLTVRRLPLPYALYALGSLALIVLLPMHREDWGALSSNKRFLVDVFPFFLALGVTRPRRWIEPLIVILALLLQVLLTVVYLQRGWVA